MLICIADSEYFNIALKAYINEPNSKPLDIKEGANKQVISSQADSLIKI
ncbi:hypothetical protein N0S69_18010, partial [Klebsiella pneumoniae]|nr:hypothetical protein [Klebsiella pneumoniae]MEC5123302.1 hypothetical protein [Klebsiella pneumoniae]